jgi:hypothetical protein
LETILLVVRKAENFLENILRVDNGGGVVDSGRQSGAERVQREGTQGEITTRLGDRLDGLRGDRTTGTEGHKHRRRPFQCPIYIDVL